MRLTTPYPINKGSGFKSGFFLRLLNNFFYSCISPFSMLLQTSLSKDPSETSTIFYFPVSVCNSNIFRVAGSLKCLCC